MEVVLRFIQYSREAFGALWECPAGEVAVKEKIWTPRRPHPELISARMEEGKSGRKEERNTKSEVVS